MVPLWKACCRLGLWTFRTGVLSQRAIPTQVLSSFLTPGTSCSVNPSPPVWQLVARSESSASGTPQESVVPSKFDKQCLVKAKMYPSMDQVPETISGAQLRRARDYMRVRVTVWMMVLTFLGSGIMIWWGRHDRDQGKSVKKMGEDKIATYRKKGLEEEETKKASEQPK